MWVKSFIEMHFIDAVLDNDSLGMIYHAMVMHMNPNTNVFRTKGKTVMQVLEELTGKSQPTITRLLKKLSRKVERIDDKTYKINKLYVSANAHHPQSKTYEDKLTLEEANKIAEKRKLMKRYVLRQGNQRIGQSRAMTEMQNQVSRLERELAKTNHRVEMLYKWKSKVNDMHPETRRVELELVKK